MDIVNKRVVITGTASGIGRSMAIAFYNAGAKSILISDINEENLNIVADQIHDLPLKTDVIK